MFNQENIEVRIVPRPTSVMSDVFILCRIDDLRVAVWSLQDDGTVIANEIAPGVHETKPTFTLPFNMVNKLVAAFIEYGASHGVRGPDRPFVEGKLEGTEAHLEDLRTLLKLNKPTVIKDKNYARSR
jgi:hypothetical protein